MRQRAPIWCSPCWSWPGREGLREGLATPQADRGRPRPGSTQAGLAAQGVRRLPTSLPAALDALEADATVKGWLPPLLLECYLKHKRGEIARLEGLSEEEQARRYGLVY